MQRPLSHRSASNTRTASYHRSGSQPRGSVSSSGDQGAPSLLARPHSAYNNNSNSQKRTGSATIQNGRRIGGGGSSTAQQNTGTTTQARYELKMLQQQQHQQIARPPPSKRPSSATTRHGRGVRSGGGDDQLAGSEGNELGATTPHAGTHSSRVSGVFYDDKRSKNAQRRPSRDEESAVVDDARLLQSFGRGHKHHQPAAGIESSSHVKQHLFAMGDEGVVQRRSVGVNPQDFSPKSGGGSGLVVTPQQHQHDHLYQHVGDQVIISNAGEDEEEDAARSYFMKKKTPAHYSDGGGGNSSNKKKPPLSQGHPHHNHHKKEWCSSTAECTVPLQLSAENPLPLVLIQRSKTDRLVCSDRLNLDSRGLEQLPCVVDVEQVVRTPSSSRGGTPTTEIVDSDAPCASTFDVLKLLNLQNNKIGTLETNNTTKLIPTTAANHPQQQPVTVPVKFQRGTPLTAFKQLIFLDLYNNKIHHLGNGLRGLDTLRVLMLGKNCLTSVAALEGCCPLLDVLDLHNNSIGKIAAGAISHMRDLRILNIAGNKLNKLDFFSDASNTATPTPEGAQGTAASTTTANGAVFRSLEEINARRNHIAYVAPTISTNCPRLSRLYLSSNSLGGSVAACGLDLGIATCKQLQDITLEMNPIVDDYLDDVTKYHQQHQHDDGTEDMLVASSAGPGVSGKMPTLQQLLPTLREYLVFHVQSLETYDGTKITAQERGTVAKVKKRMELLTKAAAKKPGGGSTAAQPSRTTSSTKDATSQGQVAMAVKKYSQQQQGRTPTKGSISTADASPSGGGSVGSAVASLVKKVSVSNIRDSAKQKRAEEVDLAKRQQTNVDALSELQQQHHVVADGVWADYGSQRLTIDGELLAGVEVGDAPPHPPPLISSPKNKQPSGTFLVKKGSVHTKDSNGLGKQQHSFHLRSQPTSNNHPQQQPPLNQQLPPIVMDACSVLHIRNMAMCCLPASSRGGGGTLSVTTPGYTATLAAEASAGHVRAVAKFSAALPRIAAIEVADGCEGNTLWDLVLLLRAAGVVGANLPSSSSSSGFTATALAQAANSASSGHFSTSTRSPTHSAKHASGSPHTLRNTQLDHRGIRDGVHAVLVDAGAPKWKVLLQSSTESSAQSSTGTQLISVPFDDDDRVMVASVARGLVGVLTSTGCTMNGAEFTTTELRMGRAVRQYFEHSLCQRGTSSTMRRLGQLMGAAAPPSRSRLYKADGEQQHIDGRRGSSGGTTSATITATQQSGASGVGVGRNVVVLATAAASTTHTAPPLAASAVRSFVLDRILNPATKTASKMIALDTMLPDAVLIPMISESMKGHR